jgi:hypothetical protein
MQEAHLYEAILLVNRGVDEAVRGLERLEPVKDSQLDSSCFDDELVLFEDHRVRLNSYRNDVNENNRVRRGENASAWLRGLVLGGCFYGVFQVGGYAGFGYVAADAGLGGVAG